MYRITQTFVQHILLNNIFALSLLHDEHNLKFDKQLHLLDKRLHNLTKINKKPKHYPIIQDVSTSLLGHR